MKKLMLILVALFVAALLLVYVNNGGISLNNGWSSADQAATDNSSAAHLDVDKENAEASVGSRNKKQRPEKKEALSNEQSLADINAKLNQQSQANSSDANSRNDDSRVNSTSSAKDVDISGAGDTNTTTLDKDQINLFIRGRVLDDTGAPVPSALITAATANDNAQGQTIETVTDYDGWFALDGLTNGVYNISATDPVSGNSSQTKRISTDTNIIDLIIPIGGTTLLFGAVTQPNGEPVADASLRLLPAGSVANTDDLGVYTMEAVVKRDVSQLMIVEKDGYITERKPLRQRQLQNNTELQFDISLRPEAESSETAMVSGVVVNESKDALGGLNVKLANQSYRYNTQTDRNGTFSFDEVVVDRNYVLRVQPRADYEKFVRSGINVPKQGLSNFNITLEERGFGTVTGRFISAAGGLLANYTSSLLVSNQSIPIKSDTEGVFAIEDVPTGKIRLSVSSNGRLLTSGAELRPGNTVSIDAVVDVGEQQFIGLVVDQFGEPVGGAKILWRWELRQNGLLHESLRNAVTDSNGRFALSGFAAVPHELRITAAGHATLQTTVPAAQAEGEFTLQ